MGEYDSKNHHRNENQTQYENTTLSHASPYHHSLCSLTVCVTCVWAGVDNAWEQKKLEARKILENAAESHTSGARCVGLLLDFENQTIISDLITILGCKLNQFWISRITFMCNVCSEGTSIWF